MAQGSLKHKQDVGVEHFLQHEMFGLGYFTAFLVFFLLFKKSQACYCGNLYEICMKESSWKRLAWQVQLAALILGAAHCVCAKASQWGIFHRDFLWKEVSLRRYGTQHIFFAIAVIAVRPWLSLWQDLFPFRHLRETLFRFLVPLARRCLSNKSGRQSGSTMPTCKTSGCDSCTFLRFWFFLLVAAAVHCMLYLYIGESSGRQESRAGRARERSSDGEIGLVLRVALNGGLCGSLCFGPFYDPTS